MDDLIEFLIDILLEFSMEVIENPKIPRVIRYPLAVLIILLFLVVCLGLIILGIASLRESLILGVIIISLGVILLIFIIKRFVRAIKNERNKKSNL